MARTHCAAGLSGCLRARSERSTRGASRAPRPRLADRARLRHPIPDAAVHRSASTCHETPPRTPRPKARLHHAAPVITVAVLIDLVAREHQYSLLAPSVPAGFLYRAAFVTA